MNNLITNLANKINNNKNRYKHFLIYPISKLIIEISRVLFKQNFIRAFFIINKNQQKYVYILLKYSSYKKTFEKISKISKTISYKKTFKIIKYTNGLGLSIISTQKGLITSYDSKKLKLGGLLIIKIY